MRNTLPNLLAVLFAFTCVSCGSMGGGGGDEESKNRPKYAEMKMDQRISNQFRNPRDIRNPFSKGEYKADEKVKGKSFKTKEYAGSERFRTRDFKTKEFSQKGRTPRESGQTYSQADSRSRMESQEYGTEQNAWGTKRPSYADRESSDADEVYDTRPDPTASRGRAKSTRPYMLPETGSASYTEFDLKKMLKR